MKISFISILLITAASHSIFASQKQSGFSTPTRNLGTMDWEFPAVFSKPADQPKKFNAQETLQSCENKCQPSDNCRGWDKKKAENYNDLLCVARFRHCLAKCRIDYKHALKQQESTQSNQDTSKQN